MQGSAVLTIDWAPYIIDMRTGNGVTINEITLVTRRTRKHGVYTLPEHNYTFTYSTHN